MTNLPLDVDAAIESSDERRAAVLRWYEERCYEIVRLLPDDSEAVTSARFVAHRLTVAAERLEYQPD